LTESTSANVLDKTQSCSGKEIENDAEDETNTPLTAVLLAFSLCLYKNELEDCEGSAACKDKFTVD